MELAVGLRSKVTIKKKTKRVSNGRLMGTKSIELTTINICIYVYIIHVYIYIYVFVCFFRFKTLF